MWVRALGFAALVAGLAWMALSVRHADEELEQARAELLRRWEHESASMGADERDLAGRVARWVAGGTGEYAGDFVADELPAQTGLRDVLKRPMVYVRGALADLRTPQWMKESTREAGRDALLLCLLDPPDGRAEMDLVRRTLSAYGNDERMRKATAHVRPLGPALVGLSVLDPVWRGRVVEAKDRRRLGVLGRILDQAPLEEARQAARASLLLFAIDEPGELSAPPELDGERPHHIRLGLVDLTTQKELVRFRRRVDPSWLSDSTRAELARGVDDCTLAFDLRQALSQGSLR